MRNVGLRKLAWAAALTLLGRDILTARVAGDQGSSPAALGFFEKRIRPVLVEYCLACHSGKVAMAGLRLDLRGGWEAG